MLGLVALVLLAALPARGQNLIANGDFEGGRDDAGQPVGWHSRLTSIIAVPQYADPVNKKGRTGVVNFKCGCGADWGTVRPWTHLWCPHCGQMNTGLEDSGDWYVKNHENISLAPGARGQAVTLRMDQATGEMQGVRVLSAIVRAQRGAAYEFGLDAISQGVTLRAWVEGFQLDERDQAAAEWAASLPREANPLGQQHRLKRVFRHQIHVGHPGQWTRYVERFKAPSRNEFDYLLVSLYAYAAAGEARYDNIVLRQLTAAETEAYLRENPGPREQRLR